MNFTFHHQQPAFTRLLMRTQGVPHGRQPLLQEDDVGAIWQVKMSMSDKRAYHLLLSAGGSLLPKVGEYLIFTGDETYLHSMYCASNQRYYLLQATAKRYLNLLLRGEIPANVEVYQALQPLYGMLPQASTLKG